MLYHPLNHKLDVIRTLYDRCDITTEAVDMEKETDHVNQAMSKWSFKKVSQQLDQRAAEPKRKKKDTKERTI